jgi:hypothetical protein
MHAVHEGESNVGHVVRKPGEGAVSVCGVLECLGGEAGDGKATDAPYTITNTSENEDEGAHGVREPFGSLRIIPIEYIARGRVTVTEKEVQFAFGDIQKG